MTVIDGAQAVFLGVIEGLTEFLPVSSTGHLLLTEHFLGMGETTFGKTFAVLIQLGAILAILSVYIRKLIDIAITLPTSAESRRFTGGILLAFLPAAVIGASLHGFIKGVLFNPWIICISLIVGGFVLMVIDGVKLAARHHDVTKFSMRMYFGIGVMQCLAMIPGVSRSGATIVGAMLMGADKRAAAEFSFWLAMPTMAGAFAYDLYESYHDLNANGVALIAIGFAVSFVCALFVVRGFLDYVSRHGFITFAWWRIIVGAAGLAGLLVFG